MQVNYSSLTEAAAGLSQAASVVSSAAQTPTDLGSGAALADSAHSSASAERTSTLQQLGELMSAQSSSCTEMVTLFKLLDAQAASQVP